MVEGAASFEREIADVRRKVDPSGEVVDEASPELKSLRDRLRKQRARLRGTLESYLRGKDTAKYLQQQIVTDRNGRYVLVIRAENRTAIPGIVHGSSASGASLFLEPLSTVEINNDIVALEQEEQAEVHRILLALSDAFRGRAAELHRTIDAATALDVAQAKARYSLDVGGVLPKVSRDGRLELRGARHPLLIARGIDVTPVDVLLIPPARALVITGPNTGGKTVALKTAGLLPIMAQSGLLIPAADGTEIPILNSVFADIGDEQSIADNLSTFSAHIANVVAMDQALALPALVLLDEAGGGTDPNEGGALATAIIDHFRRRGAMVVATTHFDALKTYASTTEGVTSAGFGFNPETFAPTYRLHYGSPGSSLALEIATRLGLPGGIIEQARAQRTKREAQLAEHLAQVERERQGLEHEHRLVARERQMVEETQKKLQGREQDLRDREETFRKRLDQKIEERLRDARREIDTVVDALKARAAAIPAGRLVSTGEIGTARADARSALESVEARLREGAGSAFAPFGSFGETSDPRRRGSGRGWRWASKESSSRFTTVTPKSTCAGSGCGRGSTTCGSSPRRGPVARRRPRCTSTSRWRSATRRVSEINVIGAHAEEAVERVERFLDEAMVAELKSLRIIHGYGTGALRRSIAEFLRAHAFVANFHPAQDNQGGGGVTVVELKE